MELNTMKKTISFLLAILLMTSCFVFHSPDANALGAVWVKEFYKDKFGDVTGDTGDGTLCSLTQKQKQAASLLTVIQPAFTLDF